MSPALSGVLEEFVVQDRLLPGTSSFMSLDENYNGVFALIL